MLDALTIWFDPNCVVSKRVVRFDGPPIFEFVNGDETAERLIYILVVNFLQDLFRYCAYRISKMICC